jgi:hypothetical protein
MNNSAAEHTNMTRAGFLIRLLSKCGSSGEEDRRGIHEIYGLARKSLLIEKK